jgi:hypothetical protein
MLAPRHGQRATIVCPVWHCRGGACSPSALQLATCWSEPKQIVSYPQRHALADRQQTGTSADGH